MPNIASMPAKGRQVSRLKRGEQVFKTVTVNRSPEECFDFFRKFENLPLFIKNLKSVVPVTPTKWHCVGVAPNGKTLEWNADITNEQPNRLIEWRTEVGAPITHAGSVRFQPGPPGRGTEVHVSFEYDRPIGSALLARMAGEHPALEAEDDLARFKALLEAGEIPTTEGQPRGPKG